KSRLLCSWLFFFSSRRRHTRFSRDWSSDVCSSDLFAGGQLRHVEHGAAKLLSSRGAAEVGHPADQQVARILRDVDPQAAGHVGRSEERRVGKEGSARKQRDTQRRGEDATNARSSGG